LRMTSKQKRRPQAITNQTRTNNHRRSIDVKPCLQSRKDARTDFRFKRLLGMLPLLLAVTFASRQPRRLREDPETAFWFKRLLEMLPILLAVTVASRQPRRRRAREESAKEQVSRDRTDATRL
jgi:hypothetical protein